MSSEYNSTCPECKSPAYAGFSSLECSNCNCSKYKKRQPTQEELIEAFRKVENPDLADELKKQLLCSPNLAIKLDNSSKVEGINFDTKYIKSLSGDFEKIEQDILKNMMINPKDIKQKTASDLYSSIYMGNSGATYKVGVDPAKEESKSYVKVVDSSNSYTFTGNSLNTNINPDKECEMIRREASGEFNYIAPVPEFVKLELENKKLREKNRELEERNGRLDGQCDDLDFDVCKLKSLLNGAGSVKYNNIITILKHDTGMCTIRKNEFYPDEYLLYKDGEWAVALDPNKGHVSCKYSTMMEAIEMLEKIGIKSK